MSDLIPQTQLSDSKDCPTLAEKIKLQKIITREAQIGAGLTIRRALPHRERRMIGAWCFFDHFGPLDLRNNGGLSIAPHPHMGLQTFTYLITGKILHRDSLGSMQHIEPGEVNLMTAGFGISHSEESVADHLDSLHGVQLWIALPNAARNNKPDFVHYPQLPVYEKDGLTIKILAGSMFGHKSPATVYSALVGLHVHTNRQTETSLALNAAYEYGILVLNGQIQIDDQTINPGVLLYAPPGHKQLSLRAAKDTHIFIIGGEPFKEEVLLWWNFVARNKSEIEQAAAEWEKHQRFGEVKGYPGSRLDAPAIPW